GPLDHPLDVLLSIAGTATEGTDYQPLPGSPVTIPAGASTLSIPVVPIPDAVDDDGETVVLTVEPGLGYTVGMPSSATVTISEEHEGPGGPPSVLEIPTLGPWGLALLVLLLLGAGIVRAR
ncbi:MAG TPA: IPTL-CTERM sorting domain-containing protein, partial [Thermoanaerobaculia bacterium]|nr:IPTL-CTERM sorting domain-containing protein [Thermoanaerobaculia bacterium]